MTMTRIYPGMLCQSKEYFNSGEKVMLIHDGRVQNFDDVPDHPELARIIDTESKVAEILSGWFGDDERQKQKMLARCRFGALNFFADFNEDEAMPDYCRCPHRGSCAGEGVVCHPATIGGETVTQEEVSLLKEVCCDDTNTAIARRMGYAQGTYNVKKNKLYQKLNIKTKQSAVLTLVFEGLL